MKNKKHFRLFRHFFTITHHRHLVFIHAIKCGLNIFQAFGHDLSKYSFIEFIPGVKYFQGDKSPNELERETLGFSHAWLHHKGRNKHHFEYWYDYSDEIHAYVPVKIPLKYVKEMFCDRLAASKTYLKKQYTNSSAWEYFSCKNTKRLLYKQTGELLESWLLYLKEHGEKETFKLIRKTKKY